MNNEINLCDITKKYRINIIHNYVKLTFALFLKCVIMCNTRGH